MYEAAARELFEEAGLVGDIKYKGIVDSRTYQDDNVSYNHYLFIFFVENSIGDLTEEIRKVLCRGLVVKK